MTTIGMALHPEHLRAAVSDRRGRVIKTIEVEVSESASLEDFKALLNECPRGRIQLAVASGAGWKILRRTPSTDREGMLKAIRMAPHRWFIRYEEPMWYGLVIAGSDVAFGGAIPQSVIRTCLAAAEQHRSALEEIVVAPVAYAGPLDDGTHRWPIAGEETLLRSENGSLVGWSRTAGVNPPSEIEEEEEDRFWLAKLAATSPAIARVPITEAKRSAPRLAVAVGIAGLLIWASAGAFSAYRSLSDITDAQLDLEALRPIAAETMDMLDQLTRVSRSVAFLDSLHAFRSQDARLMSQLAQRVPANTQLTSLRRSPGDTVTMDVLAESVAAVLEPMTPDNGFADAVVLGPVARVERAGVVQQQFTVRFRWQMEAGRS